MYRKVCDGFFYRNAYYDKPLAYMPYASAGLIETKNAVYLKSYTTFVCKVDDKGWLQCTGIYSRTTMKHIAAFTKQFCNGKNLYHICKAIYQDGKAYNIYTGEILNLDPNNYNNDGYGFATI